jgi:hypothetical protein
MSAKEKIEQFLETENAKDVKILLAYVVKNTKTDLDDKVLENSEEYAELLATELGKVNDLEPTEDETLAAVMRLVKQIVEETPTKWDDRIFKLVDLFI